MIFAELGEDFLYEVDSLIDKALEEQRWKAQEDAIAEYWRRRKEEKR